MINYLFRSIKYEIKIKKEILKNGNVNNLIVKRCIILLIEGNKL